MTRIHYADRKGRLHVIERAITRDEAQRVATKLEAKGNCVLLVMVEQS